MKRIDRVIWAALWTLQVLVWILHQKAYGTQNGAALIVPLLYLSKHFLKDVIEFFELDVEEEEEPKVEYVEFERTEWRKGA